MNLKKVKFSIREGYKLFLEIGIGYSSVKMMLIPNLTSEKHLKAVKYVKMDKNVQNSLKITYFIF